MSCTSFSVACCVLYPYPCSPRYQHHTRLAPRWVYVFRSGSSKWSQSAACDHVVGDRVAPDPKTGSPRLVPVIVHQVQPVVAVPNARRVRRVVSGTPNDMNRKTVQTAVCERPVPPAEVLVRNLLVGFRVSAAVAHVDDIIAVVQVVLVTASAP